MGETNIKDEIVQAKVLISNGESLPQTIAVCEHIKQYQSFYTTSLKEGSFIERFSDLIYKELYRFSGNSAISTYISYGTVGYIKKWLDDGCKQSVEQVAFGMATASSKTLMESLK